MIEGEISKLYLREELKTYYTAKRKPGIIDVPPGKFITILGKGERVSSGRATESTRWPTPRSAGTAGLS